MTRAFRTAAGFASLFLIGLPFVTRAQRGAVNGEWRWYGGDAAGTKYSPLDQINAENVNQLQIVWRWKREGFGPRPHSNWQARRARPIGRSIDTRRARPIGRSINTRRARPIGRSINRS